MCSTVQHKTILVLYIVFKFQLPTGYSCSLIHVTNSSVFVYARLFVCVLYINESRRQVFYTGLLFLPQLWSPFSHRVPMCARNSVKYIQPVSLMTSLE